MSSIKRCIVLLADGARADVFYELLHSGQLPNIKKRLADKGTAATAVTGFPSTTGPAYLPFLTGCLPGTCNVPGIRWLEKENFHYRSYVGFESFLIGRDIESKIKTIFELVPDSYSIFNPIVRGAGPRNKTRYMRIWYWYYSHLTDHWDIADKAALEKTLKVLRNGCRFLFTVFPGIDEYSHLTHPHHESVIKRYHFMDEAVGEIADFMEKRGEWESTALWLVSDHGLSKTKHHFCVNTFLTNHGLPPFFYPLIFKKRGKLSANMVSGNGMTHIYFKNRGSWSGRASRRAIERIAPHLFGDLLTTPAVDIIAYRGDDASISVLSKRGRAAIKLVGEKLCYDIAGHDPFGYPSLPNVMDRQEILKYTIDSEYPDAPFQIAHIFTSKRSGDMILSATPGYDLRLKYENPEHKASHGSLHRSHMLVPILCNKPLSTSPMRTVDIFPTILKSLGIDIPAGLDGTALERG